MEKFEEQPMKRTRPQIIEEPIENNSSEEPNEPEEQFSDKSRAQIAEEELEKMRHDRLVEEAEEEFKEQSGDYKANYDQYLKEKEEPEKESKIIGSSSSERKVIVREEPAEEVAKEKDETIPEEVKEEKPESKEEIKTEAEKPSPEKEEVKDNSAEVKKLATELFGLFQRKEELLSKKNKQQGLMYRLGIKKKDSQINEEYRTIYDEYDKVLGKIAELTKYSKKEIEEQYFGKREGGESQERTPETERKAEGLKDYLYKKAKEVNEQIKNLEGGKKGSFEKIKALMKDRKFQFVVGLAIVGVAIAAPPTGFISMITFGMHAGFLPAAYATKATALAGLAGGGFIMRGLSGFADDLKARGREEVDLTDEIK